MADGPLRVVGRYALYGEIASGGMATVHFGRLLGPVGFSRTVAVKRLHPQFAKDPEFVSMFLDEARLAARIQHPNVVATLDVVALEGELFLIMEYVEGESLARLLRTARAENKPIPPRIVGAIMTNVLYGLHAAHEAKSERGEHLEIIHRDVSPQNVLVGADGNARVLDFGVAKAAGRVQTTRDGQIKGKLAYMPAEQIAGDQIDRRVDIYAAAVVTWEALTSRRLYDGGNEATILHQVLNGEVLPPSRHVAGLPPGVDEVVMRGLARQPTKRFATAWEMAVALEETLGLETPRRVAEFVDRCAHDAISVRAARVKEIESFSTNVQTLVEVAPIADGRRAGPIVVPTGEVSSLSRVSSVSVSANRQTQAPRGRLGPIAVGAVIGALGVASLVYVLRARLVPPESTREPTVAADEGVTVAASAVPLDDSAEVASATTSASAAPSSSASVAVPTKAYPIRRPGSVRPPPQVPTTSPSVTPKTNCVPPYYLENGIRKIKPACLNE